MSSELERRLDGLLAVVPEPEPGAGEEALHRALRALQPAAPARRGLRTAVLAFAAALVLLAIAAGSLAAAGALHVSFGAKQQPKPTTTQLSLPMGANGIAAIVNGRLSVVIKGGFRLQVQRATAAALSPHALYVAAGIGRSLVAIAPNGRRAWSHPTRGTVVAIAWAPEGNRIAYIVRAGHRLVLHLIWGNDKNDRVIDRSVRSVRPSWRADSLAFAYVGAGGKAIIYDVGHQKRSVLGSAAPLTSLAFAPEGNALLVATPGSAFVGRKKVASGDLEAIGWFEGRMAVALEQGVTPPLVRTFSPSGAPAGSFRIKGRVLAVTSRFVVAVTANKVIAGRRPVLGLAPGQTVRDLQIG